MATGRAVGVDVRQLAEGLNPVDMSETYFLPFEARYVAGGHDLLEQTDRYARLWTRKEAGAKVAGGVGWANTRAAVLQRDLVACVEPARRTGTGWRRWRCRRATGRRWRCSGRRRSGWRWRSSRGCEGSPTLLPDAAAASRILVKVSLERYL